MSLIEVEQRYRVPEGGVDMMQLMRRGWVHQRITFANILFDVQDGDEAVRWRIQKGNKTLRARYCFNAGVSLQEAANNNVVDLLDNDDVKWTLKRALKKVDGKRGEGKREIEDPQAIARHVLKLDEVHARRITHANLRNVLARAQIVPFGIVFTQRDLFRNQWRGGEARPDAVTFDASLCSHDVLVGETPRRIVEVETQVLSGNHRDGQVVEETLRAQETNVAWARSHLFSGEEWLEVSGTAAMCVLRHMDARDVREIYGCDAAGLSKSKLRKLRNSFFAGEISHARIDGLIEAGVINIHAWRDSVDFGVVTL